MNTTNASLFVAFGGLIVAFAGMLYREYNLRTRLIKDLDIYLKAREMRPDGQFPGRAKIEDLIFADLDKLTRDPLDNETIDNANKLLNIVAFGGLAAFIALVIMIMVLNIGSAEWIPVDAWIPEFVLNVLTMLYYPLLFVVSVALAFRFLLWAMQSLSDGRLRELIQRFAPK
ncbi:MAG: hypothetical protein FWG78_05090 [Coriobacteriia bacterium]|nr:hypothetical protein [Coriobacteriia bacterium]